MRLSTTTLLVLGFLSAFTIGALVVLSWTGKPTTDVFGLAGMIVGGLLAFVRQEPAPPTVVAGGIATGSSVSATARPADYTSSVVRAYTPKDPPASPPPATPTDPPPPPIV